ncbi:MAG: cytochrome P450 [Acidimicrobiia bacterium]
MAMVENQPEIDFANIDFGLDDLPNLHEIVAAMQAKEPATWVKFVGEPALHLNSYEIVKAGFREEEAVPGHVYYLETQAPVMGKTVQSLTGDEHRIARGLQMPFFRQRLMPDYFAPVFEPVANELIDEFVERGSADLVSEFTKQYPMRVIMKVLDLDPTNGVNWAQLAWDMIQGAYDPELSIRAIAEFDRNVKPLLDERLANPGSDLISALLTVEVDGDRLSYQDVLSFVRLMFPAGSDTTLLGMGNTLLALMTHPDAMAAVRADPSGEARWIIEEALRHQPSVAYLPRRTLRATPDWHGLSLPEGTVVLLGIMAANRDPSVYPNPEVFDFRRRPQGALTFGLAAHHCLGIHFARAEMEAALIKVLERLQDLRLDPAFPVPHQSGALLRGPAELRVLFTPGPRVGGR